MSSLRQLVSTVTGTATGIAPGSAVSGGTVFMGNSTAKVKALSALISVTALSNTITLKPRWQGSADATTWYTLANDSADTAQIALATGVTPQVATPGIKVFPAPASAYGWRYTRAQVVVGVVTGITGDTYSIGYSYRQFSQGSIVG